MNTLKIIRNAYQKGKLSLKELIPMELLVASHLKSIMNNPESKYLRETYLKARLMQSKFKMLNILTSIFVSVIFLIGFISLIILIII